MKESDLEKFFQNFMVTDESEPEEYRDDDWTDAAERWLWFEATSLSEERIEEIIESHNNHGERVIEHAAFRPFEEMGVTSE